jgi:hypothetical protein
MRTNVTGATAQRPKDPPVPFLCDEYQKICSASDATLFDTSRANNVVAVVAAQSVGPYINATGNEQTASALVANFTMSSHSGRPNAPSNFLAVKTR